MVGWTFTGTVLLRLLFTWTVVLVVVCFWGETEFLTVVVVVVFWLLLFTTWDVVVVLTGLFPDLVVVTVVVVFWVTTWLVGLEDDVDEVVITCLWELTTCVPDLFVETVTGWLERLLTTWVVGFEVVVVTLETV